MEHSRLKFGIQSCEMRRWLLSSSESILAKFEGYQDKAYVQHSPAKWRPWCIFNGWACPCLGSIQFAKCGDAFFHAWILRIVFFARLRILQISSFPSYWKVLNVLFGFSLLINTTLFNLSLTEYCGKWLRTRRDGRQIVQSIKSW